MREQILKSMKAHALGQIEKHKMNVNIYFRQRSRCRGTYKYT